MDYQEPPQTLADADRDLRPLISPAAFERRCDMTSISIAGGNIRSKHTTQDESHFNQKHYLGVVTAETACGDYMFMHLDPNSKNRVSEGLMKYFNRTSFDLGPVKVEAGLFRGFVSGYYSFWAPAAGVDMRIEFFKANVGANNISVGIQAAVLPYLSTGNDENNKKLTLGLVATRPFLSLRFTPVSSPSLRPVINGGIDDRAARKAAMRL